MFLQDVVAGKRWSAGKVTWVSGQLCDVMLPDGRTFRRHMDHVRAGIATVDDAAACV